MKGESNARPLPCPFCGAPGKHRFAKNAGLHWVECTGCEADGPAIYDYEQAIAAWNRRVPLPHHQDPSR